MLIKNSIEELFHKVADLSPEEREAYFARHNVDKPTRKEVEALLAFDSTRSVLQLHIGAAAAETMPRLETKALRCGAYRLGHLLGRGGMGAVYLAERIDGEVSQRVAIKLLRFDADDPRLRQRFLSERQILANLSHPNIARLLDAGHRDDGQPYLAMDYVEGKAIDVFSLGLSIRQKVLLFRKVCGAISYLHRNLVVHRDLKPGNILVTPEGEPKLLDFGIAKMIDLSGDATRTDMLMLTPDYASPEQVRGASVTTATDIYSLGAVFYKVLTGVSPHKFETASMEEVTAVISGGRITPPGDLMPELRGDLEVILLKALRSEPQERYSTIEQFSEDLENFAQSRPILARKGEVWYRARKFGRRHWRPIAAAIIATSGLIAGILVANHQRAIAERRFVQVRSLASQLFDIEAEVRRTPGTTKARELIVTTSLGYLDKLAAEAGGDPELALELGTGYMNIARLQGVPILANLGHPDDAIRSLHIAEQHISKVLAAQPANRTALLRMSQIDCDRMNIALRAGKAAESLRFARESEKWLRRYDATGAVSPADADALASTYLNVGNQLATASQTDEAIALCHRASEIAAAAGNSYRSGTALASLASAYRMAGRLDEALQAIRSAAPRLQHPPGGSEGLRNRAIIGALIREGAILGERNALSLGRSDEALPLLERAWSLADDLTARDPHDSDSRDRLFVAAIIMTGILRDRDPKRELAVCDHTLSRLAELPNETARHQEERMLAESSYALRSLGRMAEARRRLDRAADMLRQFRLDPAGHLQEESSETFAALAEYDAATGNTAKAAEEYEKLLQLTLASGEKPQSFLADATEVSHLYARLADLHQNLGHAELTADYRSKRIALWRSWDTRLPQNNFVQRELAAASVRES